MRTILRRVLSSTCWELSPKKSTWLRSSATSAWGTTPEVGLQVLPKHPHTINENPPERSWYAVVISFAENGAPTSPPDP
jgi:hypothetical protein